MEGEDKEFLASFGAFRHISTDIFLKISGYFPSFQDAWKAGPSELIRAGISEKIATELAEFKKKIEPAKLLDSYQKNQIKLISLGEDEYPELLKEIFNPPFLIYAKGELRPNERLAIAIVGARKCTDYGKRATKDIAEGLAKAGVTIVSGLALGLDAVAHEEAVKAGSRTIAVLANGLDQIYPATNRNLAQKILEKGAIISERPIGTPPLRQNFPARNRIISGLASGVLVTEATDKSGTLHTANFALEQGRQIYAVPGPIYNPMSAGPNNLIKMGAKPVSEAKDILEDFGIKGIESSKNILPENEDEVMIFELLKREPKHIDEISREAEREASEISRIISMMEIKGKVKHLGGMIYCLRK
jgi:DNA processing protein